MRSSSSERSTSSPGVHHLRFAQRIPGSDVRVFGADTFVHFDANGAIRFVAPGLVSDMAKISPQPTKTADEARLAAEALLRARDPQATITSPRPPELVVYRVPGGRGTLARRVVLKAFIGGGIEGPEVFVDATTGAVPESNDTAAHANKTIKTSNVYFYNDCGRPNPTDSTISYDDAFTVPQLPLTTNRLVRQGDDAHTAIITDAFVTEHIRTPIVSAKASEFDFPSPSSSMHG